MFGDPASDAYLVKFSWTDLVRHVMVTGAAAPVDPGLADYWAERRRKVKPPLDNYTLRLLARQDARCPLCGDHLLTAQQPPQSPNDWKRWWQQITRQGIAADYLVHHASPAHCTMIQPASCTPAADGGFAPAGARNQHSQPARPCGLLEPYAAEWHVRFWGDRRGNPPVLPGGRAGAADRDGDQLTRRSALPRRLAHLDELQSKAHDVNRRLLDTERVGQGCVLASPAFARVALPTLTTHRSLRAQVSGLLGTAYTVHQMSYALARLRVNGLIRRQPHTNTYVLTDDGQRVAIFYTKVHDRLLWPLLAATSYRRNQHSERRCAPSILT